MRVDATDATRGVPGSEWAGLRVGVHAPDPLRPSAAPQQLNGARLLAMREPKDVSVITTDADAQTVLLKRLRELRKISRHIKRQQQQLQQMLAQGLKDLRMSNANARAAAAAKRDTSTSGNGELVATESMPPKAPTGAGPKPEASGTGGGSSGTGQGAAHSAAAGGQHLDASSLAVAGGGSQNVDTPGAGIGGVRSARGGEDVVVDRGRAISTGEAAGPSDGGASAGNSHAHGQGPHRLANMTSDSADLRPAPKTHGALEGQGARKRDTWAMGMGPGKEGTRGDNVLVNGGMAAGHGDQTQAAEIYSGAQ